MLLRFIYGLLTTVGIIALSFVGAYLAEPHTVIYQNHYSYSTPNSIGLQFPPPPSVDDDTPVPAHHCGDCVDKSQ